MVRRVSVDGRECCAWKRDAGGCAVGCGEPKGARDQDGGRRNPAGVIDTKAAVSVKTWPRPCRVRFGGLWLSHAEEAKCLGPKPRCWMFGWCNCCRRFDLGRGPSHFA